MSTRVVDFCDDKSEPTLGSNESDPNVNEIQPDVVMTAATTEGSKDDICSDYSEIPRNPPPYSEIDPMASGDTRLQSTHTEKFDRPTSLELEPSSSSDEFNKNIATENKSK